MSTTERQEQILTLLRERRFISVKELARLTYTSASSIRRDLTRLQNQGLVERSHGGVTMPAAVKGVASFADRLTKNIPAKRVIAKKAARLLREGQSVLLDGSSTASFLVPYLAKLQSVTLFTNNISTAMKAIELGVDTHCIGGHSVGGSSVLSGTESYKTIAALKPDILFFSSQSLDESGIITDSTEEENYLRTLMLQAAEQRVFLCDSEKFRTRSLYVLTGLDEIDVAVFDEDFEGLRAKCKIL